MIVKVWGSVNSNPIVFTPGSNDVWTCQVPAVEDGEYVVDLYAVDDAGNEAYTATILFTVDSKHLIFSVKILKVAKQMIGRMKTYEMIAKRCEICGGDKYGIS